VSPRVPRETGKTTSLTAVLHRDARGRFGRARSRVTQDAASRNKLQPVEYRCEPRSPMLCSPCHRREMPSSCTSPRLRGATRYMPVRSCTACDDHAQMHASAAACLAAVTAASIAHKGSDRAPGHQLCRGHAAAAAAGATPKARSAHQRVARSTPLLHSGPENTRLRSRFEVRTRGCGRRGDGACLRGAFAHFLGKAKVTRVECSTGGATRHLLSGGCP